MIRYANVTDRQQGKETKAGYRVVAREKTKKNDYLIPSNWAAASTLTQTDLNTRKMNWKHDTISRLAMKCAELNERRSGVSGDKKIRD